MGPAGAVAAEPEPQRGGRWADHRTVINELFWRTRCGLPWRDVPPNYGHWKTVYNRHRRWSNDGTWGWAARRVAPRRRPGRGRGVDGRGRRRGGARPPARRRCPPPAPGRCACGGRRARRGGHRGQGRITRNQPATSPPPGGVGSVPGRVDEVPRAGVGPRTGSRLWQPTPAAPALIVVIDEYAELADESASATGHADSIARRGRATAVTLLAATQRPTQKAMGSGAVRSQMDVRICLRVRARPQRGENPCMNRVAVHEPCIPGCQLIIVLRCARGTRPPPRGRRRPAPAQARHRRQPRGEASA